MQWLFVCTGNTCRSAMAEAMARRAWAEKVGCAVDDLEDLGYTVLSAGTMNLPGAPASQGARAACAERGLDLEAHRSRGLSEDLLEASDLILVMERRHGEAVLALCRRAGDRCCLLDPDGEIPDPVGQPLDVFRRCADRIEQVIRQRVREYEP